MEEQKEIKKDNRTSGYYAIIAGILGIIVNLGREPRWDLIGIIKNLIPIVVLLMGLWIVFRKKVNVKD